MAADDSHTFGGVGGASAPYLSYVSDVLTEAELLSIPENVREKLHEWTSEARKRLDDTGGKYRSTVAQLAQVEESVISYSRQAAESKLLADIAVREKDEMVIVANKRNEEIERLSASVSFLSSQLQTATVAKIDALVKVDELTGKGMELDYKEKQLEREKEWTSKQIQLLNDELDKKNAEIMNIHREFNIKHIQLQTDLSEKNEQIRISGLSLSNVQKANEAQEKHIEHLMNKLRDAQDIELKMQENYRQELSAQKKIAELYKESSEEASKKVDELEDAVSSLQDLLKNATVKYGELETKFSNTAKYYQDEIAGRDEHITKIKKELETADKVIESFPGKGLTDEMLQSLSPAAAAATSMLKNTKSLTQIYSEYHDLANELIIRKQEIVKLNQLVKELLQEIKTQGPELEREKLNNQKNLEKIEILQSQLDLALRESDKAKGDTSRATKSLAAKEREVERLKSIQHDLAIQVRSLLKETQVQRGDYSAVVAATHSQVTSGVAEVPDIESPAQQVVSDRLVTFRNIEELQMQNQKLLAAVRELTDSQEKASREAHESQLQLIKDSFQEAMRELEVLREKRMTQDKLLESAIKQRDTLSELLKQQKSPVKVFDPAAAGKLADLQSQYDRLQATHRSIQEEFDTYKKERGEHEKLAMEQAEKLREDVMKMRTDKAKLASQVDYNNERAKIYNANLETYKKNILLLEERIKKSSAANLKLEQNLELLKSELSGAQQKLARTEVALNSLTQERNAIRDTNSRLQAERDMLKRDQNTQQMLRLNLQEIKNGLEMSNSALKVKMENEIESLKRDNANLRRKVSTETEHFKEAVFSWESANKELIQRLRCDQDSLQETKEQLEESKATIARLGAEIEDLQSQVKILSDATTLDTVNAAEDQPIITIPALERQIKELHTQLRDAKIENETIAQHLVLSRQNAEEYRTLCASIEGQISVVSDTSKQLAEELKERLEGKDEIIRDLQSRLTSGNKDNAILKDEKAALARELERKTVSLQEEANRMRRDLQAANSKLQSAFEDNVRTKLDLEKQTLAYQDIQEKYEKELAVHATDMSTISDLKNELDSVKLKAMEEEQARRDAENQLSQTVLDWTNKDETMRAELTRLQESKAELENLNTSLQDQIINMTTRMEASSKATEGEEGSAETDESDSQKTSEHWLQLIRYLRRAKEIAKTKTEKAEATCSTYENQVTHLEKLTEDLRKELNEVQDRSHMSIITSAKQADLLRKVETLSALTDSNRMLREEKEMAVQELQEVQGKFAALEVEIGPMREKSSELEGRCEALLNDNTALTQDIGRWRNRASALLQKSNKVNPDEVKRLQTDNDNLQKQVQSTQEANKKQQLEIARHLQQVKLLQQQTVALQTSSQSVQNEKKILVEEQKKIGDERDKLRGELQTLRLEVSSLKNVQVENDDNLERVKREFENVNKMLEEQKHTVKAVKSIARKYKKQYEDLQNEQESAGEKLSQQETGTDVTNTTAVEGGIAEAQREEIAKYEAQVKQLQDEVESLKRDAESFKTDRTQADERMRNLMKALREKLNVTTSQKTEIEAQLNECQSKLNGLEVSAEESSVRFAALKSQYEGRLGRLEKENKDLKTATTTTGNASELINLSLQQQNEDQKKELDMLKQRLAAIENQYKMQSQATQLVSPEKVIPVEKAKANIRPIAGPSPKQEAPVARPPLTASIRPISMPRKATVSVTAMPAQNPQPSSSNAQASAVVAPVSQAQVSTSTPDQSSSAPESSPQQQIHQQMTVNTSNVPISSPVRQAATVQPTVTVVAPVAMGVGVVGTNNNASGGTVPAGGVTGVGGQQSQQDGSGSSGASNNDSQVAHQDPSTSSATQMLEESEMGDSSEQVSSSEGSTHLNILTVAPLRSKQQHEVQQSSSSTLQHQSQSQPGPLKKQGSSSNTEEPSPSSSTLRPTQSSNKRSHEDPHHSHHHHDEEEEDLLIEPNTKRACREMRSVDREAEAVGQQKSSNDQMLEEEEEDEENDQEADQGSSAADHPQVQDSDTTTKESVGRPVRPDDPDSDSDVIIIDSDDEEVGPKSTTGVGRGTIPVGEEEDVEEEEEIVEDEEEEDEEDTTEEEESDEDDEDHGDDDGEDGKMDEDYNEEVEGQEGREAESLEHAEDDQDLLDSNDSNLNPVDYSSQDQSHQQHGLGEAEQSIDDEIEEVQELVLEPIVPMPVPGSSMSSSVAAGSIRPPRDLNIRPQAGSTPQRGTQAGRGGVSPLLGRHQQTMLAQSFSSSGQYSEDVDDSIVPSTPTLYVPRRSDGFAEAVSSPQIQPGGRFTFGSVPVSATEGISGRSHTGTGSTSSGVSGLDDARVDFLGYDEGGTTGRSVPSTPLQVSPPVDGVELSDEMQADEDAAQEEGMAMSVAVVMDVQPTSSSIASVSASDVPAITVTYAMESSSSILFQPPIEGTKGNQEATRLSTLGSQPRTTTQSEVSSVTSSDEDKVANAGSSDIHTTGTIQQPSTTTSSRAASPTPSSNTYNPPTEQKEPLEQPEQQQGGRGRPTPIVWDQPSSSSSSNPTSRPVRGGMGIGARGPMTIRPMIQPNQGHVMPPMSRGHRPMMMMPRGQSQSARRSRPHHRGGPSGAGGGPAGGVDPGGNAGSGMPFQEPY